MNLFNHKQPVQTINSSKFFFTFSLKESLPQDSINLLEREYTQVQNRLDVKNSSSGKFDKVKSLFFGRLDNMLDRAITVSSLLSNPEIANSLQKKLHEMDNISFHLICYTILPNHFHLLVEPLDNKQKTIKQINRIITDVKEQTTPVLTTFYGPDKHWNRDSFADILTDNQQMVHMISYTLNNPVKAGLINYWKDWPWSFCNPKYL
ncbi:MAG: transposase [Candidatus Cyclobacteriaceae bacterium M3_2C_046]